LNWKKYEKPLSAIAVLLMALVAYLLYLNGARCMNEAHADPLAGSQVDADPDVATRVNRAMLWVVQVLSPNAGNPVARKPLWRKDLAGYIAEESAAQDLPWDLVTAIVYRESSFRHGAKGDPDAEGNPRSHGLMQVGIGVRAKCRARGLDLEVPHDQVKCGTWWLREATDAICGGDLRGGMAFYASGKTCRPRKKHLKSVVHDRFNLARKLRRATEGAP
jgi:hypothetical protein